jgi:aldehyde:ferredoxin oxidoreductase
MGKEKGRSIKVRISGYAGNILHVDLSHQKIMKEALNPGWVTNFIGGYGVNVKLAYDLIPPDIDPLSPRNLIILGAGPFCGTLVPGAAKLVVTTKFPLNGAIGTASAGGRFSFMLKSAGFDHVVISGKANRPIYLKIADSGAELCDATYLWGKDSFETIDELRGEYEPCSVIPIGQAGENLVKISITSVDKAGTLGSGGLPAVMASKNLKAIVVELGEHPVKVAHPVRFMKIIDALRDRFMQWPGRKAMLDYGMMPGPGDPMPGLIRDSGTRFVLSDRSDEETKALMELHKETRHTLACPGCLIGEKEVIKLKEGKYAGMVTYRSAVPALTFGPKNIKAQYEQRIKYGDMSGRYGVCENCFDLVFFLLIYLYKNGIISKEDTGGIELRDDLDTYLKLMEMTAFRKDIGNLLADGALQVALKIGRGAEHWIGHSKGRAVHMDARIFGLGTLQFEPCTHHRGAHYQASGSASYVPGSPPEKFATHLDRMGVPHEAIHRIVGEKSVNMGRHSRYSEDWFAFFSCLGLCNRAWINRFYSAKSLTEIYSALTGHKITQAELLKASERVWNMEKMLNAKAGFSRKDDQFPEIWFTPLKDDKGNEWILTDYFKTKKLTREDLEAYLDDYYDERGWDKRMGIPTPRKLEELGIECKETYV